MYSQKHRKNRSDLRDLNTHIRRARDEEEWKASFENTENLSVLQFDVESFDEL